MEIRVCPQCGLPNCKEVLDKIDQNLTTPNSVAEIRRAVRRIIEIQDDHGEIGMSRKILSYAKTEDILTKAILGQLPKGE